MPKRQPGGSRCRGRCVCPRRQLQTTSPPVSTARGCPRTLAQHPTAPLPVTPKGGQAGGCLSPAPRRGPSLAAHPAMITTLPGSTLPPPQAPELPARLHSSIYTANSWHMLPGKEDWGVGGGCCWPGFWGRARSKRRELGGWERHRHQSVGSKQSWRRETTTSCRALLKTRRAQKGKGRKTKGLGGGRQEAAEGDGGARALGMMN